MMDLNRIQQLVNEQAEDESIWFIPKYISEHIIQCALRRLHAAIEGDWELVDKLRLSDD